MPWTRRELEGMAGATAFRIVQARLMRQSPERALLSGAKLGRLAFRTLGRRRERTLENLGMAFPEWSESERRTVALGVFEHFGRIMADFVRIPALDRETLIGDTTEVGLDLVKRRLDEGLGCILMTGHYGNWERLGYWFSCQGIKVSVVARAANNPKMEEFIHGLRQAAGMETIYRGNAPRAILTKVKAPEVIGILADQNSEESFLPFFNKPCGTVLGPSILARRAKTVVFPTYATFSADGRMHVSIESPLAADPAYENADEGFMAAFNHSLEMQVRRHPEQYLWIHDRWKSARRKGLL